MEQVQRGPRNFGIMLPGEHQGGAGGDPGEDSPTSPRQDSKGRERTNTSHQHGRRSSATGTGSSTRSRSAGSSIKPRFSLAPFGDHTGRPIPLEVSAIARTIARALAASTKDFDRGHRPRPRPRPRSVRPRRRGDNWPAFFPADSPISPKASGWSRSSGRRRRPRPDSRGRDGIHAAQGAGEKSSTAARRSLPVTLEGPIVRVSDVIAYVNHDSTTPSGRIFSRTPTSPARSSLLLGDTTPPASTGWLWTSSSPA